MAPLDRMMPYVERWSSFYGDSTLTQSTVLFLHFGALLVAGGYALAADRWVLRAGRYGEGPRSALLEQLNSLHLPVVAGLFIIILTGSAMALADAETMLASRVFWLKMGCFVFLLLNGITLLRAERRLCSQTLETTRATEWGKLQWAARRSFSLWLLTLLLGTLLSSAA